MLRKDYDFSIKGRKMEFYNMIAQRLCRFEGDLERDVFCR